MSPRRPRCACIVVVEEAASLVWAIEVEAGVSGGVPPSPSVFDVCRGVLKQCLWIEVVVVEGGGFGGCPPVASRAALRCGRKAGGSGGVPPSPSVCLYCLNRRSSVGRW